MPSWTDVLGGLDLNAAPFVIANNGRDLGSPDVRTVVTPNPFLDGDAVIGRQTGNREIRLTVLVLGVDRGDKTNAMRLLEAVIDQPSKQYLTYPADGAPEVFDCFRGSWTLDYSSDIDGVNIAIYQIVLPAFPFGHAPSPTLLTGAGSTSQVHDLESTTGLTVDEGTVNTGVSFWHPDGASAALAIDCQTVPSGGYVHNFCRFHGNSGHDFSDRFAEFRFQVGGPLNGYVSLWLILTLKTSTGTVLGTARQQFFAIHQQTTSPPVAHYFGPWETIVFDLNDICDSSLRGAGTKWQIDVDGYSTDDVTCGFWNLTEFEPGGATLAGRIGVARLDVGGAYRTPASLSIEPVGDHKLGDVLLHRRDGYVDGYDPTGGGTGSFIARDWQGEFAVIVQLANSFRPGTDTPVAKGQPTILTLTVTQNGHAATFSKVIPSSEVTDPDFNVRWGDGPGKQFFYVATVALPMFDISDANDSDTVTFATTFTGDGAAYLSVVSRGLFLLDKAGEFILTTVATNGDTLFLDSHPADRLTRVTSGPDPVSAVGVYPPAQGDNVFYLAPPSNQLFIATTDATSGMTISASGYEMFGSERSV